MDYGFEAVISPRFADIFRNNCDEEGPASRGRSTPRSCDRALLDAIDGRPALEITIDVARGTVEAPAIGLDGTFPLDDFTRDRLLNGLDDIGSALRHVDKITEFERGRPAFLPSA